MRDKGPGATGGRRREVTVGAHGLLGEPPEELGGVGHLGPRVRLGLPVLGDDQGSQQVCLDGHGVEHPAQGLGARSRRAGRPAGQRSRSGVNGTYRVGLARVGHAAELETRRGILDGEDTGCDPSRAVDVEAVLGGEGRDQVGDVRVDAHVLRSVRGVGLCGGDHGYSPRCRCALATRSTARHVAAVRSGNPRRVA